MKRIIDRIKGFDIKRMFKMIKVICERSGESFIHVFLDIFRCWIKFGSGYMDYYLFYFETLPDDIKATYINIAVNKDYIRHCNDPKYYYVLNDKPTFIEKYKDFIKRDTLDLRKCSYEEYEKFFKKHKEFMAKPIDGLCGYGIELIKTANEDIKELYNRLNNNGQLLLEERIKQHKDINAIYNDSINTLRIVTLIKDGVVTVLFRAMRIGNNGKVVDNFNNGGLMAVVEEDGYIRKPVLDKDNKVYYNHPMTGTPIVGFKVPRFDEVIELCKELAKVTPELGLCGWDIAVTPTGLDVVEGNQIPGYDIYQSREQLAPSICGIKQRFDDAIYPEKKDQYIFAKGYNAVKFIWVLFFGIVFDLLFGLLNINIPITLDFAVAYLFLYRHVDTRSFKKTCIYLAIFAFTIFLYNYLALNYLDYDNLYNPSLVFAINNYPLEVLKIVGNCLLNAYIICVLALYFVFPFIDKIIEKLNKVLGIILTILVSLFDAYFILVITSSIILVVLLLFSL